jgi:hypothetical protein
MRHDIPRRVARLEQAVGISAEPLPIVFMHFGGPSNHASSGDHEWHRRPDEEQEEFKARIVSDSAFADRKRGFVVWLFS